MTTNRTRRFCMHLEKTYTERREVLDEANFGIFLDKLQREDRCFRCGIVGHWKNQCYASEETVFIFREKE